MPPISQSVSQVKQSINQSINLSTRQWWSGNHKYKTKCRVEATKKTKM